jgi:uncharacterized iron-regulated protein
MPLPQSRAAPPPRAAGRSTRRLVTALLLGASLAGCATTPLPPGTRVAAEPDALADVIAQVPVVLLGEVHDNATQHTLRAEALARRVAAGARPALAFEQFDRERQADIDRARRERPRDADHLIATAGGPGWDWPLYRPFIVLALENDLPIVAANLSRADASRVIRAGLSAVFDAPTRASLGLDALTPSLLDAHRREVDDGHCGLMPTAMLEPMARAQIARDAALALAITPHAGRGVVLLTGNGHARRDLGVVRWLPPALRAQTLAIGLLEPAGLAATPRDAFDRVVETPGAARGDPCAALKARMAPAAPGQGR